MKREQDLSGFKICRFGPCEWLILEQNSKEALLISKEAVISMPYHEEEASCTWETCTLRKWLNDDFLKEFPASDRGHILRKRIQNPDNAEYQTHGGRDTEDRVFLLSIDEVKTYFPTEESRICIPSQRASEKAEFIFNEGACMWWLRSPGLFSFDAATVEDDGTICDNGCIVTFKNHAGRPAMWVKQEGLTQG